MFNRVLFPAPDGPIMAVSFPELNFPLIDFNSCLQPEITNIKIRPTFTQLLPFIAIT